MSATRLSQDLWMMGQSMMGMPGLLSAVAARQDSEVQPLAERVADHVYFSLMGMLALCSAPFWGVGAGMAWAGERLIEKLDAVHTMGVNVQKFSRSLAEQEALIKAFGPLLDLSDKVADLNVKIVETTATVRQSTRELDELQNNYLPHADRLVRVGDMISRLQRTLPERISHATGLEQHTLLTRVAVLKQIEEQERQMKLLGQRLNETIERVGKKAKQLQKIQEQVAQSTQEKGEQIAGLQRDVSALNPATKGTHDAVVTVNA